MWIVRLLISLVSFGFIFPHVLTEGQPNATSRAPAQVVSDDDEGRRGKA